MPLVVGLIGMIGWLIAILDMVPGAIRNPGAVAWSGIARYALEMFLTGSLVFVISYYLLELISRKYFIAGFFPGGRLSECSGTLALSIRARFFIFFFAVAIYPLLLMISVVRALDNGTHTDDSLAAVTALVGIALLAVAYDATIAGWSRALDLRDKETEGHTLRVTEMALSLARAMHLSEAELVHLRRGALLHDIGKMSIPDAILLKPAQLTAEEWEIMRRHPTYAYEMLSPIDYLRPALDIPYCHHEKWNGSGYPRGLRGEQIPLAARVFAIADVWDALRSDRPYRAGWPGERVREHIRAGAKTHFDVQVVEVFLESDNESFGTILVRAGVLN